MSVSQTDIHTDRLHSTSNLNRLLVSLHTHTHTHSFCVLYIYPRHVIAKFACADTCVCVCEKNVYYKFNTKNLSCKIKCFPRVLYRVYGVQQKPQHFENVFSNIYLHGQSRSARKKERKTGKYASISTCTHIDVLCDTAIECTRALCKYTHKHIV